VSCNILFLIFILFSKSVNSASPSTLIGGLVYYEEHSNGPIYLNTQFYTVTREVDTLPLEGFIQYARVLSKLYETQCQKTDSSFSNKVIEYKKALEENQPQTILHITNTKHNALDAESVCRQLGFILPKIRAVADKEFVRRAAVEAGIKIRSRLLQVHERQL
jgi:hypothetical protein